MELEANMLGGLSRNIAVVSGLRMDRESARSAFAFMLSQLGYKVEVTGHDIKMIEIAKEGEFTHPCPHRFPKDRPKRFEIVGQPNPEDPASVVNLNFRDHVSLPDLARAVSLWTGYNIAFDKSLRDYIAIDNPIKIHKNLAWTAFVKILDELGYKLAMQGGMVVVRVGKPDCTQRAVVKTTKKVAPQLSPVKQREATVVKRFTRA